MLLEALRLKDFRNYAVLEVSPGHGVNVFFGQNAQGKTNVLEAIFLLARMTSHRADRDQDMVRWGQKSFIVSGRFVEQDRCAEVRVFGGFEQPKQVTVNGVPKKHSEGLAPDVRVVLFVPDDLQMVKGPAAMRRRFLDQEIASVDPSYSHDLTRYTKVLSQRNALLRAGVAPDHESCKVWTDQLVEHGSRIYSRRVEMLRRLGPVARDIHLNLTGEERLDVIYRPSVPLRGDESLDSTNSLFRQRLRERAHLEQQKGMTLVGPHRDDIRFCIEGQDVRQYGSQGQQRSVVVSMKVAELHFVQDETGTYPILLLDDILSELDFVRRQGLLDAVADQIQVFLTCTDYSLFRDELPDRTAYYRVQQGLVEEMRDG